MAVYQHGPGTGHKINVGEALPEAIEKAADVERALYVVIHYEQ